jgi:lambda repressor-like predicted transcriptional regulator
MKLDKRRGATRRARFKFALNVKGESLLKWCKRNGVTQTHLNLVLRGKRVSARLDALIYEAILVADGPDIAKPFNPAAKESQ